VLQLHIYISDYYKGDVNKFMRQVAVFYQRYGIEVDWDRTHVATPDVRCKEERWIKGDAYDDTIYYAGDDWVYYTHPFAKYFKDLWYPSSAADPQAVFFSDHFSHVPSLFLVGNISTKGSWSSPFRSDIEGFTLNPPLPPFSFVPQNCYDDATTIAHELCHMLGFTAHTGSGLMQWNPTGSLSGQKGFSKDPEENAQIIRLIRRSPWLR
jgi:hypothetical protein